MGFQKGIYYFLLVPFSGDVKLWEATWGIIPGVDTGSITMMIVGPLPNGHFMADTWGWSQPPTNWDDPPRIHP